MNGISAVHAHCSVVDVSISTKWHWHRFGCSFRWGQGGAAVSQVCFQEFRRCPHLPRSTFRLNRKKPPFFLDVYFHPAILLNCIPCMSPLAAFLQRHWTWGPCWELLMKANIQNSQCWFLQPLALQAEMTKQFANACRGHMHGGGLHDRRWCSGPTWGWFRRGKHLFAFIFQIYSELDQRLSLLCKELLLHCVCMIEFWKHMPI